MRVRSLSSIARATARLHACLALAGCSALVEPTTKQCDTNDDCARIEPGATCTAEKVCAPAGTGIPCATHQECSDRLGVQGVCTSVRTCSPLLSPECGELFPSDAVARAQRAGQSVLLVGFMAALSGSGESYGRPQLEGAKQALDELDGLYGGLPAVPGGPGNRRYAMLVCDQKNWQAATEHLVKSLHVPAIVGASYSGVTREVFDLSKTMDPPTLIFSPAATSPTLTQHDDDGLLWRTPPTDTLQMEAMKLVFGRVRSGLQQGSPPVLAAGEAIKVAVTVKGETAGNSLFNAAIERASPQQAVMPADPLPSDVRAFKYDDPDQAMPDWNAVARSIVAYQPHVILTLGTNEFVKNLMGLIEETWPTGAAYRPWYLMPEGNRVDELLGLAASRPDLSMRVVGTAPGARESSQWNSFAGRYRARPATMSKLPGNLAEYAYDAMYLLAYATAIAGQPAPDGRALADALTRTSRGAPAPAGPDVFSGNFAKAARERAIDYVGVSGDLDFDNTHGEARSNFDIWCLRNGRDGRSFEPPVSQYLFATGLLRDDTLDFKRRDWCNPATP